MDAELEELVAVLGAQGGASKYNNNGTEHDQSILGKLSKIAFNSEQTVYAVQGLASSVQLLASEVSLMVPVSEQSNREKMNILEHACAHVAADEVTRLQQELTKAEKSLHGAQLKHGAVRQMLMQALSEPGTAVPRTALQDILKVLDRANEEEVRQAAE